MGIVSGVLGVASAAYSAYSSSEASGDANEDAHKYDQKMVLALDEFMSVFEGTAPTGYQSWDQFYGSGETKIGFIPGFSLESVWNRKAAVEMRKNKITPKDLRMLQKMETKEDQEAWLSKQWGTGVKLNSKYDYGSGQIDAVLSPGAQEKEGTFAGNEEIRARGGTPSIEQQYMPWIKPGQDAYQALTKAVVDGDMSGFFTSPGYAFRLAEGEKAITRLGNAGRIPTMQAQKGLVEYGQNMASEEYKNYIGNLGSLATAGYSSMQDLKSLETYYNSSKLSTQGGTAATELNMGNYSNQLKQQSGESVADAIGGIGNIVGGLNFGGGTTGGLSSIGMNPSVSTTGNMWDSATSNLMQKNTSSSYPWLN